MHNTFIIIIKYVLGLNLLAILLFGCNRNEHLHLAPDAEYSFYLKRPHFMKKFYESKISDYNIIEKSGNDIKKRKQEDSHNGHNFSYHLIDISNYGKIKTIYSFSICDTYIKEPLIKIHEEISKLNIPKDIIDEIEDFCFGGGIPQILGNLDASYKTNNLEIVDLANKGPFLDINYIEKDNICICFLDKSLYKTPVIIQEINFSRIRQPLQDNSWVKKYLKTLNINIKDQGHCIYRGHFEKKCIKRYQLKNDDDVVFTLEDDSGAPNNIIYPICMSIRKFQLESRPRIDTKKNVIFPYDTPVIFKGCGSSSILMCPSFCIYTKGDKVPKHDSLDYSMESLETSFKKLAIAYNFKDNTAPFVKAQFSICQEDGFYKEAKASFNCFSFFIHCYMFWDNFLRNNLIGKAAVLIFIVVFCIAFPLKISVPLFYSMLLHNICLSFYNTFKKHKLTISPNTIQILYESWCEIYGDTSGLVKYIFYITPIFSYFLHYYYNNSISMSFNAIVALQIIAYSCYYEYFPMAIPLLLFVKAFNAYPEIVSALLCVASNAMLYFKFF